MSMVRHRRAAELRHFESKAIIALEQTRIPYRFVNKVNGGHGRVSRHLKIPINHPWPRLGILNGREPARETGQHD